MLCDESTILPEEELCLVNIIYSVYKAHFPVNDWLNVSCAQDPLSV